MSYSMKITSAAEGLQFALPERIIVDVLGYMGIKCMEKSGSGTLCLLCGTRHE